MNDNHTIDTLKRDSALKKVQSLIKKFNSTFVIEANIEKNEEGEEVASGLRIKELKDNGSEFLDEIFDTLVDMVRIASDEHELVYDEKRGFAIARRKVTYEIEEQ